MYVIRKFNEEVLFSAETEQEVKDKALEGYGLEVEEYDGELSEYLGATHSAEYIAQQEEARVEQAKQNRIAEIKKQLEAIDLKSIRAIREQNEEYIAQYEQQAQTLRSELQELIGE